MTAQQLIYSALRRCGQLRPGYTPNTDLLNDGLNEFLAMYDGYNAQRTMAYSIPDFIFPIAGAKSLNGIYGTQIQFTIGPPFTFAATTQTSVTVLVPNTQGLIIGQYVTGTDMPANTYIKGITTNTSITISAAATGSHSVTLTVTASFTGPRPEAIVRMNLYMTSTSPTTPTRIPLAPVSAEEWANIATLALTPINVTTVFWYDAQFPQGVINVWPPLSAGNSLEFFTWGFLTPPVSLSTSMLVPPGYQDVIVYDLARRLWPMCTLDILPNKLPYNILAAQAMVARDRVMAVNAPMPRMVNDFRGGAGPGMAESNWQLILTGTPY